MRSVEVCEQHTGRFENQLLYQQSTKEIELDLLGEYQAIIQEILQIESEKNFGERKGKTWIKENEYLEWVSW